MAKSSSICATIRIGVWSLGLSLSVSKNLRLACARARCVDDSGSADMIVSPVTVTLEDALLAKPLTCYGHDGPSPVASPSARVPVRAAHSRSRRQETLRSRPRQKLSGIGQFGGR